MDERLLTGLSIMVVDDERMVLETVSDILKDAGAFVHIAVNASHALAMLRRSKVDLIILDREMPEVDGIALLKEIKEDPDLYETPVIMLTGAKTKGEIQEALEAGANGYVIKPFSPAVLKKQIQVVFEKRKSDKI